jgi:hypothetical protein
VSCASISLLRSFFPLKPRSTCGRSELPKAQPASVSNASNPAAEVPGLSGSFGSMDSFEASPDSQYFVRVQWSGKNGLMEK